MNEFFTGRKKELDKIKNIHAVRESKHTAQGVYLIQGPPGTGKTALLMKLEQEIAPGPERDRNWLERLLLAIKTRTRIGPQEWKNLRIRPLVVRTSDPKSLESKEALYKLLEEKASSMRNSDNSGVLGFLLGSFMRVSLSSRPSVLLLIDHAHLSGPENQRAYLHLQGEKQSPPITTIFAGYPGSDTKLESAKLSRPETLCSLHWMEPDDARHAMEMLLDKFKACLEVTNREAWLAFAEESGKQALHLCHVLQATIEVAIDREGQLDEKALDKAKEEVKHLCNNYFSSQFNDRKERKFFMKLEEVLQKGQKFTDNFLDMTELGIEGSAEERLEMFRSLVEKGAILKIPPGHPENPGRDVLYELHPDKAEWASDSR